jgi:hypothetical protein
MLGQVSSTFRGFASCVLLTTIPRSSKSGCLNGRSSLGKLSRNSSSPMDKKSGRKKCFLYQKSHTRFEYFLCKVAGFLLYYACLSPLMLSATTEDSRLSMAASIATVTAAVSSGTIRLGRKGDLWQPSRDAAELRNRDWIELSALTDNCSKLYPARGILSS